MNTHVAVIQNEKAMQYPQQPPYSPIQLYPEYPFPQETLAEDTTDPLAGIVYQMVRDLLIKLRLDAEHIDTPQWNPFRKFVQPGGTILVKPNLVRHYHSSGGDIQSVITHGAIIRPVIDYAYLAVGKEGNIIVGDAPIQDADFTEVIRRSGLDHVINFYKNRNIVVQLIDFRSSQILYPDNKRFKAVRKSLPGDPLGNAVVDLGSKSWLCPIADGYKRYRVTCYDPREMATHHNLVKNEYLIARSALEADLVINIPKMKTHRKVGITACLKNLVGINANKDWLPHHRIGPSDEGGDEYCHRDVLKSIMGIVLDLENVRSERLAKVICHRTNQVLRIVGKLTRRDPYTEGSWYGNDTAWRMALDLNRLLVYASKNGTMQASPQRKIFSIVDGIIGGDGEGPLEPESRPVGVVLGGNCPVAVDAVIARLMGFDFKKIPLIRNAFFDADYPLFHGEPGDISVVSNVHRWEGIDLEKGSDNLAFKPPAGWRHYIELGDK